MEKVLTMTQEERLQTRERESTDRIPPGHYFQPTYHFYCRDCKKKLELPPIKRKTGPHIQQTTLSGLQTANKSPGQTREY